MKQLACQIWQPLENTPKVVGAPFYLTASGRPTKQGTDEVHHGSGDDSIDWFVPVVADAEAGFGGVLNAFELMKSMIDAGAAGVHFEDQLASAKKCGHMDGKVLVPTQDAVQKLIAARLAADIYGVPTVAFARTDAEAANLVTSDFDERDRQYCTGERTKASSACATA